MEMWITTVWGPPAGTGSAGVLHLGPELEDRLGVHLADAGLGDAQDLPDLGQGEALVVVEGDHDLLALAEPVDGPGQDALHLLGLEDGHRVLGALVLQGVDQAEPVAALGADREQLVEGHHHTNEIWLKTWCSSSVVMPSCWATSASVGLRCRRFSGAT